MSHGVETCRDGITLQLPHDVCAWSVRNSRGEVPSRWPYGLDKIRVGGEPVAAAQTIRGPGQLVKDRIRRLHRGQSSSPPSVTWDEYSAMKTMLSSGSVPKASGVIWLTDWVLRGEGAIRNGVMQRILSEVEYVWTLSTAQTRLLAEILGRSHRIETLAFGVDSIFFTPSANYPTGNIILSLGNDADRDLPGTIRIARQVRAAVPSAKFVIQTPRAHQSEDGIEIVRRLTHAQIRELYAASSLVLINTRDNTHVSGMTVALEAMASGRPVLISDTLGMEEYVPFPSSRFGVGDISGAAAGVLSLLSDPVRAYSLGLEGRSLVESKFNTTRMAADLSALLERAVSNRGDQI